MPEAGSVPVSLSVTDTAAAAPGFTAAAGGRRPEVWKRTEGTVTETNGPATAVVVPSGAFTDASR